MGVLMKRAMKMPKVPRAAISELLESEPIAKTIATQTKVLRMFPNNVRGMR